MKWTQDQATITKIETKIVEMIGMKIVPALILVRLRDTGNRPQTTVELTHAIDNPVNQTYLSKLIKHKLIERNRAGHHYYVITATPEGLAMAEQIDKKIANFITKITRPR